MNPEIFAEWLRRQGHKIYKTESSYWFNQGPRVYQAFPYHWVITPSDYELITFLKGSKSIGLRYSTPITAPYGIESYHAVYNETEYTLEGLSKWARKNVRKGLKNSTVFPITFDKLASDGYELQLDTLKRQNRKLLINRKIWENRCKSAINLPGFQAWGAFVGNELAASVITFQMDNWAYMLYQQCKREYLDQHVNNALSFVVTNHIVQTQRITNILYGLHSLDAPPSVDEFKFRMGYYAKPVKQRVVFSPFVAKIINSDTYRLFRVFGKFFSNNSYFSKAEGLMRFYIQGSSPGRQQGNPNELL